MNMDAPKPPLALIAGPTASGKSAAAVALAERVGGTIVNADSAQVYRDLRVLTARPDADEEARAPHRLFGHVDGADTGYSAARWAAEARGVLAEVWAEGRVPILVGGTGLYLRTLIDGIAPVPPIDPAVRAAVRALTVADAHAALTREDAGAAARLHPNDTTRVARALEVVRSTGRPIGDWQARREGGIGEGVRLSAVVLLPPRATLAAAIDARAAAMLDAGATDEAARLIARADLPVDAPIRRAIGVAPLAAWAAGRVSREAALADLCLQTRQYAKRQATWFRHQTPWPRLEQKCSEASSLETLLSSQG